ncbi:MAG: leucyl/phenylalanyl-tRNA--protein transferase [Leptolyngbya sp.]|nr:leucyl/phenylalanyl-tRNA--protein transferase [Candidatus Melainabacteria bacterium]
MEPEFTAELVLRAYTAGIFPMGHDDNVIRWYSPDPRCIIELDNFHASKRLLRTIRQGRFDVKINSAWDQVMRLCADRESTWITEDIIQVYTELHDNGLAHSVEAFLDGELVGGLYGVSIGGAFMGESMFHTATDASKVCLYHLVERMKERGFVLLDSQYVTDHLSTFNARNIPRKEYLSRLKHALTLKCVFD